MRRIKAPSKFPFSVVTEGELVGYHVQVWVYKDNGPATLMNEDKTEPRLFPPNADGEREAKVEAFNIAQYMATTTQVFAMRLLQNPERLQGHSIAEFLPLETDEQAQELKL